jgi:hypothetical protein
VLRRLRRNRKTQVKSLVRGIAFSKTEKGYSKPAVHTSKVLAESANVSTSKINQGIKLQKEAPELFKQVAAGTKTLCGA